MDELMQYFHFTFNVYLVLPLVVLLNCIKVTNHYFYNKKNEHKKTGSYGVDLVISLIVGFGIFNLLMFQGVLADITTNYSEEWFGKVMTLCAITVISLIVQFIFCYKISRDDNQGSERSLSPIGSIPKR